MTLSLNEPHYLKLWFSANIEQVALVKSIVKKIQHSKDRYITVSLKTGVPWEIIGAIHYLESGLDFRTHLHNGDPLTGKTIHVPKNRPKLGVAPFSWEESAEDALNLKNWSNWSLFGSLYFLEMYNGFGYAYRSINSPYLWSFTQHYTKGKFVRDRIFDNNVKSKQVGAVPLLKGLGYMCNETNSSCTDIIKFGDTGKQNLQKFLNSLGADLLVDGLIGKQTSDAFFRFFSVYLHGDPRNNT